jgi:16S rRNA (uracil1498-N3)-methyltransferase
MDAPSFHSLEIPSVGERLVLGEEGSRHAVSVLRMREGALARLVDGRGVAAMAEVRDAHKKKCTLEVIERGSLPDTRHPLTLAVSLLKNPSRFEWMLEKVCELGVRRVVPLIVQRTERQRVRQDRLEAVALSAMLQSQQAWMTEVSTPIGLDSLISDTFEGQRLIAHCLSGTPTEDLRPTSGESVLLVGPEGDFTDEEVYKALAGGFRAVRLGKTRLRSETAGVAAAAVLCIGGSGGMDHGRNTGSRSAS